MPVKAVKVHHIAPGDWTADITLGVPNDGSHDDPTITLNSGEGVELPPKIGDIMLVRPPEILGYVNDELPAITTKPALGPALCYPSSAITEKVVSLLRERDAISLSKYQGKTMDRQDLTAAQWARHLIEEQADGIKYAMRMEGGLILLEEARRLIGKRSPNEAELEWVARHDAQFPLANV